jgi:hypothetical protein
MGAIYSFFGKTRVQELTYTVLATTAGYEIRRYPDCIVASVNSSPSENGYHLLARYIGGYTGAAENFEKVKMEMQAPVIMSELDTHEAGSKKMSFVLPPRHAEDRDIKSYPSPTDKRVILQDMINGVFAVKSFTGPVITNDVAQKQKQELMKSLISDGLIPSNLDPDWRTAQYHPPWTLPFLRRNEVWVRLSESFAPERLAALEEKRSELSEPLLSTK